jgi:hypothetical protein
LSRPFDAARYAGLLEGLEATELLLSEVLPGNDVFRLDADYFGKSVLIALQQLSRIGAVRLCAIAKITDGIHESLPFVEDGPVKVLSAKHPRDNFIDTTSYETISQIYNDKNPRTALREGDVLLSTVGTIGNAAVVTGDTLPANSDRHIGIIRLDVDEVSPYFLSTFLVGKYGRAQSLREATGNVQLNLFISKIDQLLVPRFSARFEQQIATQVASAYKTRKQADLRLAEAEQMLLHTLGLDNWQPPEPQSYVRSSRDAFSAGRLDAEYFSPATRAILEELSRHGDVALSDICKVATGFPWQSERFMERGTGVGDAFVRIRDCRPGAILACDLDMLESPYAITQGQPKAKRGDLVVGMDGLKWFYASQLMDACYINQRVAWLSLTDTGFPSEYLLTALNSMVGQRQLLSRMTIAHTVGHITLEDLRHVRIPILTTELRVQVATRARTAIMERLAAIALLDAAKRAVEVAIEDSEAAALAWLATATGQPSPPESA